MANKKRKKSHTAKRRHRRRMGAVNLQSTGTKIAGYAAAAFLDNIAAKNFTTLSPMVMGIAEIAAGIFLPNVVKNNAIVNAAGDGLVAVGTIRLLRNFKVISGVGAIPMQAQRVPLRVNGYNANAPAIGNSGKPFLTSTVGSMPSMEAEMMGALLYEE